MRFLGHVVSKEGIAVDPAKVVAIQDGKLLRMQQKFIKDFKKILAPLT